LSRRFWAGLPRKTTQEKQRKKNNARMLVSKRQRATAAAFAGAQFTCSRANPAVAA
jgi:hypothetical protein